jgi:hypothetical protein
MLHNTNGYCIDIIMGAGYVLYKKAIFWQINDVGMFLSKTELDNNLRSLGTNFNDFK